MSFEDRKNLLLRLQHEVLKLAREASVSSLVQKLDNDLKKLREGSFHLVLLGQFKRGKTTLVNAILGEQLLPTAVIPLTSILTLIRYGNQKCVKVIFDDGREHSIGSLVLDQYVTVRGNPNNEKRVRYVEIQYPSDFLREGIVLIDTPGIGSLFLDNTTTTLNFIPNIDAAIFLLSADLPMTQAEFQFLEDVRKNVDKIFFVLNKIDTLLPMELGEAIEYNLQALRKQIGDNNIKLFPLSSRLALEERNRNSSTVSPSVGLTDFESALESFLNNEQGVVLLQKSEQRVRNNISELRFVLELELRALEMPLVDLQQKIELLKTKIVGVQKDRDRFSYIFTGVLSSLELWIDDEINEFKRLEIDYVRDFLSDWIKQQEGIQGRVFLDESQQKFSDTMIASFDTWRRSFEPKLTAKYQQIAFEFKTKIDGIAETLRQIFGSLFDIAIESLSDFENLSWEKTFTYIVEDGTMFLEFDALRLAADVIPKNVFKEKVRMKIIKEVEEKVERNCGRLRYEYSYSLQESARKFRSDFDTSLDHILDESEHILQQAVKHKQESEKSIQSQIDDQRNRLTKLKMLEQMLSITP